MITKNENKVHRFRNMTLKRGRGKKKTRFGTQRPFEPMFSSECDLQFWAKGVVIKYTYIEKCKEQEISKNYCVVLYKNRKFLSLRVHYSMSGFKKVYFRSLIND